nr:winged helix DNA-binding domain-containing protein [uncultured Actinotalea sp.]
MGGLADTQGARPAVSAAQVRTFRLDVHGLLDHRASGAEAVLAAAGRCGIQDSPPGAASTALHARVRGTTAETLRHLLATDRTLVRTWAVRGAPFVVPTRDLAVFTTGVLPVDQGARTHLVGGVRAALEGLPGEFDDYVAATARAVREVLAGKQLEIGELGRRVADRIGEHLDTQGREAWSSPGPFAADQELGEAVVHFCLRILALQQVVCFGPRSGRAYPFVLVPEWCGALPRLDAEAARRELVTRFLHAYGPSTPAGLARWLGLRRSDVAAWWGLVTPLLVRVVVEDRVGWVLASDLDALRSAGPSGDGGVRLLPPGDPYLQSPDRSVLLQDVTHRRALWRPVQAPGGVLLDAELVGTWRGRTTAVGLHVTVEPFRALSRVEVGALRVAASSLAGMRGADEATVTVLG